MMKNHVVRRTLTLVPFLAIVACTTNTSELFQGEKVDYKSASSVRPHTLEVPPDLTALPKDDRYDVPEARPQTATLSGYTSSRASTPVGVTTGPQVLPVVDGVYLERAGSQRWLVVDKTPSELWPILLDFWQENGFLINSQNETTGTMETDWAENRSKIPQDFVRDTIGKLFGNAYSTGERDKFRTRLERHPEGGTEVYISHYGAEEMLVGPTKDLTAWEPRASDPGLEAIFLRKFMVRLGVDPATARKIVPTTPTALAEAGVPVKPRATLVSADGTAPYVELNDPFDRAWRRVGLSLDRVNFTVEDRDRTQGVYFVRYVDPGAESSKTDGPLSNLFKSEDAKKLAVQYRVLVKEQPDRASSRVMVMSKDGVAETGPVALHILQLLNGQLK